MTGSGTSSSPYGLGDTGTEYATASSGDNKGKRIFTKIPAGDYTIYETDAPTGYDLESQSPTSFSVTVSNGGSIEQLITNKLRRSNNTKSGCR